MPRRNNFQDDSSIQCLLLGQHYSSPSVRREIAERLRQTNIFVITCQSPLKIKPASNDFLGLSVKAMISMMDDRLACGAFKRKRGSKESCKRFTIMPNVAQDYLIPTSMHRFIGQSKKFLKPDDIFHLKLLEEPELVICESTKRCESFEVFNIPSVTFLNILAFNFWLDPIVYEKRIFIEGSLHHALKTRFAEHFGLKYVSLKALKKEGLIL